MNISINLLIYKKKIYIYIYIYIKLVIFIFKLKPVYLKITEIYLY